jgi:hypothetical protein
MAARSSSGGSVSSTIRWIVSLGVVATCTLTSVMFRV